MKELSIENLRLICGLARTAFGDSAIVAGGAPRDVLSGVEVKDIDVFVRFDETMGDNETAFAKSCRELASFYGVHPEFREVSDEYGIDICEITPASIGKPIQIIGIKEFPIDDVVNYDFGLSQVFVTPAGLFYTDDAISDRANRRITYTGFAITEDQMLRSKARLARLRTKYPEWNFVGCEALDEMPDPNLTEL